MAVAPSHYNQLCIQQFSSIASMILNQFSIYNYQCLDIPNLLALRSKPLEPLTIIATSIPKSPNH
jgi:hypothetical protein